MSRGRGRRGSEGALLVAALAAIGVIVLLALSGGCDLLDPARRRVRARIRAEITHTASYRRWFKRSRERALVGNYDVAPLVVRFYRRRGFSPAWCTGHGPKPEAFALAGALDSASVEGLEQEADSAALRRRLESLESGLLGPRPEAARLADLDLWLTRSFFKYAAHLSTGLLDPARLPADWHLHPRRVDLVRVLEHGLRARDLGARIAALRPPEAGYARLRGLLARERAIARSGDGPLVPPGPTLRTGSTGPRVRLLGERLALEGDLERAHAGSPVFDAALASALRRFQARHGLDPTGVAGPRELAELNVPASARVRQIELNLERWRWLPDTLGERYVLVNVPAFALEVHEDDRVPLRMRVVVGRELSRTPLFSDSITSLVFHPSWDVPPDIAVGEMLPAAQKDAGYFTKNHLRVSLGRGRGAREVDPASVNWRTITPATFHFAIKQDAGPDNAVGRVIFRCPNPYSIYLHDTPAGHLFSQTERDFSHGCIRVEKPFELAEYLLRGKNGWDSLRVAQAFDSLGKRTVFLPRAIPVHVLYWTAWVDEEGRAQFRRDVYGLDSLLTAATSHARGVAAPPIEWARLRRDTSAVAMPTDSARGRPRVSAAPEFAPRAAVARLRAAPRAPRR